MELTIPNRFESLREAFGDEIRPLIVPIDADLETLNRLQAQCRVQNGGILSFLLGPTGIGKTTTVYSAAVNMPEVYAPVVAVPSDLSFRDAVGWVIANVHKDAESRSTLVLFDGREVSDDKVGLRQFVSSLNQFLRRRSDVLFCWPTTDTDWHTEIRQVAEGVGGSNLVPEESDLSVAGPKKKDWPIVLERILLQTQKTFDDIGVASSAIEGLRDDSTTVGDFLTHVGSIIADRVSKVQVAKQLPRLIFVVTSSGDASGEANRIRRAGTQFLAAEPLLGHSPRSEPGKWWHARNRDPNHHLGYMISLFEARLVTITPSAVGHACLLHGANDLKDTAENEGMRPHTQNAKVTFTVTDFYRFFAGQQIPEFTSSKKGPQLVSTKAAYDAIQKLSNTRHKAINEAICALTTEHLSDFAVESLETALGNDLICDVIVTNSDDRYHLEFHHLSDARCKASSIASYIMGKLRLYSIYHNLIPR